MQIVGFVVVRLPNLNYPAAGGGRVPVIDDTFYWGVDRQRWADVCDEDFYSKKCPEDVWQMARTIKKCSDDFTGIDVSQDVEEAQKLLKYANRKALANELIALRSGKLEALKGAITCSLPVEWIGYDFVATGEWSLIASGIFLDPDHYSDWIPKLNRHGLFNEPDYLTAYVSAYERAATEGKSEPLAPKSAGLDRFAIEVGRVSAR